jgi:hypothetical protein
MNATRLKRAVTSSISVTSVFLLGAMTANAEIANWKIGGANITKTEEAAGALEEITSLLVPLPSKVVMKVSCAALSTKDGLLFVGGTSSGIAEFKNCETSVSGTTLPACKPSEPIVSKFKGELLAHEKHTYIKISPSSGTILVTLLLGEECAFPEELKILESLVVECSKGCEVESGSHSVAQASSELFPGQTLKFEGMPVTVDGRATLSLGGGEKGKAWSGVVE